MAGKRRRVRDGTCDGRRETDGGREMAGEGRRETVGERGREKERVRECVCERRHGPEMAGQRWHVRGGGREGEGEGEGEGQRGCM